MGSDDEGWLGLDVIRAVPLEGSTTLCISRGSVVDFTGDAIVNAANESCLGGGGVDGAISRAGGAELFEARRQLPIREDTGVRCPTGDAVVTVGGDLDARWVVHAVGPSYDGCAGAKDFDRKLTSAYASALQRAEEVGARTVAFALISSGIFRGRRPLTAVLRNAVLTVAELAPGRFEEVHLVGFTRHELVNLLRLAKDLEVFSEHDGNEETQQEEYDGGGAAAGAADGGDGADGSDMEETQES